MTKILAESLYEFREIHKEENVDSLNESINEGLNSKQKAALAEIVAKDELTEEDLQKYDKFLNSIMKVFKLGTPGTKNGDLALKYRKKIMAEKAKYAAYVLKFAKVYNDGLADKGKAKLFGFNPQTKQLDIRLGNQGKSSTGSDLGQ